MISRIVFTISIISLALFSLLSFATFGNKYDKAVVLILSILLFLFIKGLVFIFFGKDKESLPDKDYLDYADKIFYLSIIIGIITSLS